MNVIWFRRDLRLDDNDAWSAFVENGKGHAIVDSSFECASDLQRANRQKAIDELAAQIKRFNVDLKIVNGATEAIELLDDIDHVFVSSLPGENLTLPSKKTELHCFWSNYIVAPGEVLNNNGQVHRVFGAFYKSWLPMAKIVIKVDLVLKDCSFIKNRLNSYETDRDFLFKENGTSAFSEAFSLGSLSPRQVAANLPDTQPAQLFLRQLCWRDWYAHLLNENPKLATEPMLSKYKNIKWLNDPEEIDTWKKGETGFPIVDAGMRQLVKTGKMHNRARMIAASFLVKHLLVDWRIGEEFFKEHLLDYDKSQNVGNWQWVAGTGPDAAPYFRVFSPDAQQKKFDPEYIYIKRWIPKFGSESYPKPMVDHSSARNRAIETYKSALKAV